MLDYFWDTLYSVRELGVETSGCCWEKILIGQSRQTEEMSVTCRVFPLYGLLKRISAIVAIDHTVGSKVCSFI